MSLLMALACAVVIGAPEPARVHCVTDISHDFTFYMDGRFARNYLRAGDVDVRNWGTLGTLDLSRANLLVLQSGGTPCPYPAPDLAVVRRFLGVGGGVAVLGDYAVFAGEKTYRMNELASAFGASFVPAEARAPIASAGGKELRAYGGRILRLAHPAEWTVLARDADGRPVAARRTVGRGSLLLASRALAGRNPDASDPINADWWRPLLVGLAERKTVDAARPPLDRMPEIVEVRDGLRVQCSEYLRGCADEIRRIYAQARPALERILGVPPSPGMLTSLILLTTDGGGFSNGRDVALGVWWGGFPGKRYGMVELLGHESTHSWVLPYPEPMWNEGIATYVGIRLGCELGLEADARASLDGWLRGAEREDPGMAKADLTREDAIPHVVSMAKPMWIFEQLRKEKPEVLARYFQAKRRLAPASLGRYTADDSAAVLSVAAGRDLFPWLRSLGISVDRSRAKVAMEGIP